MSDSLQATTLLPLPDYQTIAGQQDSLPFASTKALNQTSAQQAGNKDVARQDNFETYLNRQGILTLARHHKSASFDTAADILSASVYKPIADAPV